MQRGLSWHQCAVRLLQKAGEHRGNLALLALSKRPAYLQAKAHWLLQTALKPGLHRLVGRRGRRLPPAPRFSAVQPRLQGIQAVKPYVTAAYPGVFTLFRPRKPAGGPSPRPTVQLWTTGRGAGGAYRSYLLLILT